jgi:hypothetical protein
MRFRSSDRKRRTTSESEIAAGEAERLERDAPALVDAAVDVEWYSRVGNDVDLAAYKLCLLRRARSGEKGATHHGDEAVRGVLAAADPAAVRWLASRMVSYLDENGYPDDLEPWFGDMSGE